MTGRWISARLPASSFFFFFAPVARCCLWSQLENWLYGYGLPGWLVGWSPSVSRRMQPHRAHTITHRPRHTHTHTVRLTFSLLLWALCIHQLLGVLSSISALEIRCRKKYSLHGPALAYTIKQCNATNRIRRINIQMYATSRCEEMTERIRPSIWSESTKRSECFAAAITQLQATIDLCFFYKALIFITQVLRAARPLWDGLNWPQCHFTISTF